MDEEDKFHRYRDLAVNRCRFALLHVLRLLDCPAGQPLAPAVRSVCRRECGWCDQRCFLCRPPFADALVVCGTERQTAQLHIAATRRAMHLAYAGDEAQVQHFMNEVLLGAEYLRALDPGTQAQGNRSRTAELSARSLLTSLVLRTMV